MTVSPVQTYPPYFAQADVISEAEAKSAQQTQTETVSEAETGLTAQTPSGAPWMVVAMLFAVLAILVFLYKDSDTSI